MKDLARLCGQSGPSGCRPNQSALGERVWYPPDRRFPLILSTAGEKVAAHRSVPRHRINLARFHFQEIQNGVMTNRNTLIPAGSLLEALGNNDLRQIVGFAMRGAFWGARDRTPSHVPRVFLAFVPS
jgi:hypothetical protein